MGKGPARSVANKSYTPLLPLEITNQGYLLPVNDQLQKQSSFFSTIQFKSLRKYQKRSMYRPPVFQRPVSKHLVVTSQASVRPNSWSGQQFNVRLFEYWKLIWPAKISRKSDVGLDDLCRNVMGFRGLRASGSNGHQQRYLPSRLFRVYSATSEWSASQCCNFWVYHHWA